MPAKSEFVSGNDTNFEYSFNLDSGSEITVEPKSSKTVYYKISNTNDGTVRYRVSYKTNDDLIVKVYEDSEAPETGIIEKNENKFVKLKIINESNTDGRVELSTILGYEKDINIIIPSNVTTVSNKISKTLDF